MERARDHATRYFVGREIQQVYTRHVGVVYARRVFVSARSCGEIIAAPMCAPCCRVYRLSSVHAHHSCFKVSFEHVVSRLSSMLIHPGDRIHIIARERRDVCNVSARNEARGSPCGR